MFRSVTNLQAAVLRFIDDANHNPKPFVWIAEPRKIIAAVNRGHKVLELIH